MTPQELKNSILQLAIEGRLVEQRKEEGTAEELYAQIQTEKARLIAEGKLKKQKALPEITEEEKPFEIPASWKWVRLGEVCKSIADGDHQAPPQVLTGIPFLVISNISTGKLDFTNTRFVTEEYFSQLSYERIAEYGDILFSVTGSYGIPVKVKTKKEFCFQRHIALLKIFLDWDFAYIWLKTPLIKSQCDKTATGTAQKTVGLNTLKSLLLPLPPLSEQHRIVAKIEELLPYIDRYEKAWSRLEEFNKRFPSDMQKSLLQYAIEGRLVEQREEEGTAEELYAQIQAEKAKLIAEGKLKKQKALPEITEEEKPFEIPASWKWCHIGDIFAHNTGKALNRAEKDGVKLTYITTSNLYWNDFKLDNIKEMLFQKNEIEKCTVQKNDLLVCEGGDFGRAAIWNNDTPMRIQNHIHRLRAYSTISVKYIYYIFYLYKNTNRLTGKGIGIKGLSSLALHSIIIPLPPLAEQHRIVARLEELLPLCERLKK